MTAPGALQDLYRDVIVEHGRSPHHVTPLVHPDASGEGMNPLCGDEVRVELRFAGASITGCAAWGVGCAISRASASMMTDELEGLSFAEARSLIGAFEAMLTRGEAPAARLGELTALAGVAKFPARVKCALLPWKVLTNLLAEQTETRDSDEDSSTDLGRGSDDNGTGHADRR